MTFEVRFDGNTIYASNDGNTKEIIKDTSKIQMQPLDLLEDIYSISKIKELSDKKIIGLENHYMDLMKWLLSETKL